MKPSNSGLHDAQDGTAEFQTCRDAAFLRDRYQSEIVTKMMSLYDADDVVLLEELLVGPRVRSVPEELCAQTGVFEQQCIEEHL